MTDKTCKDRIGSNYRSAMREIKLALGWIKPTKKDFDWFGIDPDGMNEDQKQEAIREHYFEDILSLSDFDNTHGAPIPRWFDKRGYDLSQEREELYPHRIVNLELSWGGPADGFVFFVNSNTIHEVYYYFQDWFDGATLKVTGSNYDAIKGMFEELIWKEEYRSLGGLYL